MTWWTSAEIHPKTKSKFVVVFGSVFYLPNVKSLNKPKVTFDTKEYRLLNHKFNYPGNATWEQVTINFVDMNGMGNAEQGFDTAAFLWQIMNNTGYRYPYVDNSEFRDPHFRNVIREGKRGGLESGGGHHISTKINFRDNKKTDTKEKDTWRTMTTPEKSSTIANSFGLGLESFADFEAASSVKQKISIYQIAPKTKTNIGRNNEKNVITECWHLINPVVKSINWGELAYESDELVEYELSVVYDWAVMDRTKIGEEFEIDALPYQDFMKTLFVDNPEAFAKEKITIAGALPEKIDTATSDLRAGAMDLNGDGSISDKEKRAFSDPNYQKVMGEMMLDERLRKQEEEYAKNAPVQVPESSGPMTKPSGRVKQPESKPLGNLSQESLGGIKNLDERLRKQFDELRKLEDEARRIKETQRKIDQEEPLSEQEMKEAQEILDKKNRGGFPLGGRSGNQG